MSTSAADLLIAESRTLSQSVSALKFGPHVAAVYNPLGYAREPWETYLRRAARNPARVVFMGMNPGPWGMAQTGVPFGEIAAVRDWMGIRGTVGQPPAVHPKRPVEGFACARSEVSGRRLWGLMMERFGDPDSFFAEHFVANYCPLVFMAESGRNVTPDKLPAGEREPLFALCDSFLRITVDALDPAFVVGVGKFAETRIRIALGDSARATVCTILHPSPASPAANRGWAEAATSQLIHLGIWTD